MTIRFLLGALGTGVFAVAASQTLAESHSAPPTFNKDIAPILYSRCAACHRPGEGAPFSLLSYHDAQKRGAQLVAVTQARTMPPWKPGPSDHAFEGDSHLTETQLRTLQEWVAGGMHEGDPSELPPPPKFTPGWQLGPPDLVVKMPAAYSVPADGPDIYRNFVLPLHLSEDVWVRAIDFRPSARAVVHHSLFFTDVSGKLIEKDGKDGSPGYNGGMGGIVDTKNIGALLQRFRSAGKSGATNTNPSMGGWAVGAQAIALPDGLSYHIPKGGDLVLSTHFHPSGKVEQEQSVVGLYFSKTPPRQQFTMVQLPPLFGIFSGLKIPAGAKNYTISDSFTLPVSVKAFGIAAHAHYLAKTMKLTAIFPNGKKETLLWIPDWDFNWQGQYQYEKFVDLPQGTVLESTITYDNSADNPHNPASPPKTVAWGEQSNDEMGTIGLRLVAANENELPKLQQSYRDHIRSSFLKHPRLP